MVRRLTFVVHSRRPHFRTWIHHISDHIICVASLGLGKGCIRFWGRLDQNFGFHGNRKLQLTNNGGNDVSTFSLFFWSDLFFKLAGNEDRHKISDEFEFRPDRTTPRELDQLAKPTFRARYAHTPFGTEWRTDGHSRIYYRVRCPRASKHFP